jgi:hypothetical protein
MHQEPMVQPSALITRVRPERLRDEVELSLLLFGGGKGALAEEFPALVPGGEV